jgi:DNA-binding CsgD family transcriptional regulator
MEEQEQHFTVLRSAAAGALSGAGSILLVTGEVGSGKTFLLKNLAADLGGQLRVLTGRCDNLARPQVLGPLREFGGRVEAGYDELVATLTTEPTALLIDDLQWADTSTLDLLGYLAHRIADLPLTVVLALRAPQAALAYSLQRWLGDLASIGMQRLPLAPFSLEVVQRLATEAGRDGDELFALTAGSPFFVTQLLTVEPGVVPPSVTDAVLSITVQLEETCRLAVEQLAVIAGGTPLDLAEEVIEAPAAVLSEAERCGLLEVHNGGIRFRHELARRAIEDSLPRLQRRNLRRAVANKAPAIARHATAVGHHEEAIRHLDLADEWRDELEPSTRARLDDEYAWSLCSTYRFTEAVERGRRAIEGYEEAGDSQSLSTARARLERYLLLAGDSTPAANDYVSTAERLYQELRLDELDRCLDEGLSFAMAGGLIPEIAQLEAIRSFSDIRRGRWATGLAQVPQGAKRFAQLQERSERIGARISARRDPSAAERLLEQFDVRESSTDHLQAVAEAAWLTGRGDIARSIYEQRQDAPGWGEILRYCARAGLSIEVPDSCPEPWAAGLRGEWAKAAALWEELGAPYEQALELAESNEIEPTRTAARLLDDLGAWAAARIVRRRLRDLGLRVPLRGPSAATRAHPRGLTARQSKVAEGLMDGLTNQEIAEKLVVSVRTVDHHVSAILNRLGVRTRREVAAELRNRYRAGVG